LVRLGLDVEDEPEESVPEPQAEAETPGEGTSGSAMEEID
jgi:hypothetical protein